MRNVALLFLMLCIPLAGYAQITPVNIGTSPNDKTGDPLRTAFDKLNKNDAYLDTLIKNLDTLSQNVGSVVTNEFVDNVGAIRANIDVVGPGTVTLTNGSAAVVGIGTNFTDATSGKGISYWYSFHVTDQAGTNYMVFLSTITNATSATISYVYTDAQLKTPGVVASATFPGVTGTYTYKIVRSKAKGNFASSYGNNTYAENFSTAFGGLTTASGQTSFAMGAQTLATGSRSFAGGWGAFSSNMDRRVLASGQAAFNFSQNFTTQTVGHGALALGSAILGGKDHNIPSNATYSAILGGDGIKVSSGVTNTVHFPKIRFGLGSSAALTTDNTNNNILVRDATTGEVKLRDASTIGGGFPSPGTYNTTGSSAIVTGGTIEIVSNNSNSGYQVIDANASGGAIIAQAVDKDTAEPAGFVGDLDNTQGFGSGFYFLDSRGTPHGLEYPALSTYESTGTDGTLISRGFANSSYWKTNGNTNLLSGSSITLPSDQINPNPVFSFKWLDNANTTNYFMDFTTFQDDFFTGIGPMVRFGSDNINGGPLLLKATHQPSTSAWFDDLTYVTKQYVDNTASFSTGNGVIELSPGVIGLSTGGSNVTNGVALTPSTNGTQNFLLGTSTGNAYQAFHARVSNQAIFFLPSGFFRVSGSATNFALDVEAGATYEIRNDETATTGFQVTKTGTNFKVLTMNDNHFYVSHATTTLGQMGSLDISENGWKASIDGNEFINVTASTQGTFKTVLTGSSVLDFPSTTSTSVSRLTVTVINAAIGDPVSIGIPDVSVTATGTYSAWVSAVNTVTIQFSPKATEDPASGTFKVTLHKQ